MKKTEVIDISRMNIPETLEDLYRVMERINELQVEYPNLQLERIIDDGYDEFNIYTEIEETDQEYKARLEKEKQQKKLSKLKKVEKERKLLERLKKKYE